MTKRLKWTTDEEDKQCKKNSCVRPSVLQFWCLIRRLFHQKLLDTDRRKRILCQRHCCDILLPFYQITCCVTDRKWLLNPRDTLIGNMGSKCVGKRKVQTFQTSYHRSQRWINDKMWHKNHALKGRREKSCEQSVLEIHPAVTLLLMLQITTQKEKRKESSLGFPSNLSHFRRIK